MSFESWLLFMAVWIAASIPLGPNALNCMATSADLGLRQGLWSVAGVFAAAMIHMTLALSGIAAFMLAHPVLFDVLRWAGVAYLAWMGISMFRKGSDPVLVQQTHPLGPARLVTRAIAISLSNPKAIFAWLAVFSQFVDAASPLGPQLVVLAPSALSVTVVVYIAYCGLGTVAGRLFTAGRKRWFDRLAGSTYLFFAAGLAYADLRRT